MSEWSHRNQFIRKDDHHERWLSKRRLQAIGHALFSHVAQDPTPAQSTHYRPPELPEMPIEALGERPEIQLPLVDPVTGGIRDVRKTI